MKEILKEHLGFKKQIFKLSKSELIKTYKGAALGPAWAIINPAITIFVYWFAFGLGLRVGNDVDGVPFFLYLVVGMTPWFFMKEAILGGATCLRNTRAFITKMRFPVSTIPTYTLLSSLYSHFGLVVVMYIIVLCYGYTPSLYNLQIFFYMPLMYLFFLFLSWLTAPLCAISKDFHNIIKSIITAIFWLSGILWNPYTLENPIIRYISLATPVTYFANGYRNTFILNKWFFETPYETICCLVWLVVMGILGAYTYKRLRKTIPDVL